MLGCCWFFDRAFGSWCSIAASGGVRGLKEAEDKEEEEALSGELPQLEGLLSSGILEGATATAIAGACVRLCRRSL